jgi:hypothetical protein
MSKSQIKTTIITVFDIKGSVHFKLTSQGKTVNQAYYVELLKQLCEAVHRKRPELWPNDWILHHDNASPHKALSIKQFLAQKLITKMEHPPYSPDIALNDFWLFPKIKSATKGRRLHPEKCDSSTENYPTTGVPNMFNDSSSTVGLNAQLLKGSTLKVTLLSKL